MKDERSLNDRRFVEKRSSYNVKHLWEHHHQILRLVSLGMKNEEIARELNLSAQTVSNIRNSSLAQEILLEQKEKLDEEVVSISRRIEKFTPIALQLLEDIIEGKITSPIGLQARTAESYLGRAGYGQVHKNVNINSTLSTEELRKIKERALSAKERNDERENSIEVEFTKENCE